MLSVSLVTSPHVRHPSVLAADFEPAQSHMYTFAPVGLLSLIASVRERLSYEPKLFDLNRAIIAGQVTVGPLFYRHAAELIAADEPQVVGFMTECDSYHHVLQIAEQLSSLLPACKIVLGGPHASSVAHATMERCAAVDAVVCGEGEKSFAELLDAYENSLDKTVKGVVLRRTDGTVSDGGPPELIADLDNIPVPAYERYQAASGEEIFVEVGRGCPFSCTFCSTAPFWQRKHRVKSPARILQEIKFIQSLYGSQRVHFTHDLLTTDRKWLKELCHALQDAGTPVAWTCSARTDLVDEDLLSRMAAAGCAAIYFGIESGSSRVLADIRKDIPPHESLDRLRLCRSVGIKPNAGFIVGLPTDDEESVRQTFASYEEALRAGCSPTHLFGFCPFAGSSVFQNLPDLQCDGHFLDLPLGAVLDDANRGRIAADSLLHGSYFRPRTPELSRLGFGFIEGVDQFSALVEGALLPSLHLAGILGGMFDVYRAWIIWVGRHNALRGVEPQRRWYGTPTAYCNFLQQSLLAVGRASGEMSALAEVIGVNHEIAFAMSLSPPTAMASYRSFSQPDGVSTLGLQSSVMRGSVLATLAVEYDVVPALAWRPGDEMPTIKPKPMHLAWQRHGASIRILEISDLLFGLINCIPEGTTTTIAELAVRCARGGTNGWTGDFEDVVRTLSDGVDHDLISRVS